MKPMGAKSKMMAIEIFGKVMSISDELMMRYYEVLTDADLEDVEKKHPKEAKLELGQEIVRQFYSEKEAVKARQEFERVFSQRKAPEDMLEYKVSTGIPVLDVLVGSGMVCSKNEGRRLLKQGAISLDGKRISDETQNVCPGILKVGKRRFLKMI